MISFFFNASCDRACPDTNLLNGISQGDGRYGVLHDIRNHDDLHNDDRNDDRCGDLCK